MAKITAQLNYLRMAPRKIRTIVGVLKGMDVNRARLELNYRVGRAKMPLIKLLNSAVANARNNFLMVEDNLFIKDIIVNEGAKLKRYRPKGFGRTAPIQKKTSQIKMILGEKTPGLRALKDKRTEETREPKQYSEENVQKADKRPEVKKELGKKWAFGGVKNISRRLFRRKTIS